MMRRFNLMETILFTALFFTGSSAWAVSGAIHLPVTGQVNCYDSSDKVIDCFETGQDGDIQAGVAWPAARFTDNSIATATDLSVTDNLTGLVWAQNGNFAGDTISWQASLNYINDLNINSYLGHNDWRLPNRNELESLVNKQVPDQSVWLNLQGFKNVQRNYYWSSSTDLDSTYYPGLAWNVYMWSGYVNRADKTYKKYFLPVRTGLVAGEVSLPVTGQTYCYTDLGALRTCSDTGADGEKQVGVAWPSPRFTDNSVTAPLDLTLTDNLTGLIWTKSGFLGGQTMTWQDALTYIQGLNTNTYSGYNDWRLPNRNELQSLINVQYESQVDWLQSQGFVNVAGDEYWSSSTSIKTDNNYVIAWHINMRYGIVSDFYSKPHPFYVWPVRSVKVAPTSWPLTVTKSGSGTVTTNVPPGTLSWSGATGTASYPDGTPVTLTATPETGSSFGGWGGDCSGSDTCTVSMTAVRSAGVGFDMYDYVRMERTTTTPYGTLGLAYTAAKGGDIIMAQEMVFTGALALDRPVAVTLQGGYASKFDSRSGFTTLKGKLSVSSGSVVVDRVAVK